MLFVDAKSNVDKEALRQYVARELEILLDRIEVVLYGDRGKEYWDGFHNMVGLWKNEKKKTKWLKVEAQLINLDKFVKGWVTTSVETPERFEFFVLSKAEEIASGDQQHDYFWALQIRHDQLVALVEVLTEYVKLVEELIRRSPKDVVDEKRLKGLADKSMEELVYFRAEKINKDRNKVS